MHLAMLGALSYSWCIHGHHMLRQHAVDVCKAIQLCMSVGRTHAQRRKVATKVAHAHTRSDI